MKITSLQVHHVAPVLVPGPPDRCRRPLRIGEACLEGKARVVEAAIRDFEHLLLGRDPRRMERLWLEMPHDLLPSGSILASAISAVDQALWTSSASTTASRCTSCSAAGCGTASDVPARQRRRPRGRRGGPRAEHIEELAGSPARPSPGLHHDQDRAAGAGPGLESPAFVDFQAQRFAALREAVGPDVDVAIDFHGRVGPALAKVLIAAIEPYQPVFVEEPCLPEHVGAMADVAASTTVPIATGERLFTRWGFREVLEKGRPRCCSPTSRTAAASPRAARSRRSPRPTTPNGAPQPARAREPRRQPAAPPSPSRASSARSSCTSARASCASRSSSRTATSRPRRRPGSASRSTPTCSPGATSTASGTCRTGPTRPTAPCCRGDRRSPGLAARGRPVDRGARGRPARRGARRLPGRRRPAAAGRHRLPARGGRRRAATSRRASPGSATTCCSAVVRAPTLSGGSSRTRSAPAGSAPPSSGRGPYRGARPRRERSRPVEVGFVRAGPVCTRPSRARTCPPRPARAGRPLLHLSGSAGGLSSRCTRPSGDDRASTAHGVACRSTPTLAQPR